ncbi:ribonuclease HII [Sphingomicrobium lutaoense]|uniref:Ribonuclease HII n=1 Tax=Sphingomicrobium lutaoense TaxID=515949 RepID=A0A839YYT1_9SPHN|nr:ribonuclease HII [Sphingomicrobium lutaoense]MBB3763478.1 ribonuclease HII [Sphingomicrobium lutaoense]
MIRAGVDEAGRGPLAGPVVAAAVILCPDPIEGLDDSKKLTPQRRAELVKIVRAHCLHGVGVASVEEIDRINIFQATMLAMHRAMEQLCKALEGAVDEVLVDGNRSPGDFREEWRWPTRPIVGGDGIEPCISAASIVAKEVRDEMMREADLIHPGYGFGQHKGYCTKAHVEAIRKQGPCDFHRRSFAPIAQYSLI